MFLINYTAKISLCILSVHKEGLIARNIVNGCSKTMELSRTKRFNIDNTTRRWHTQ